MAHARCSHIYTAGLKSDVTIVFLDPNFESQLRIKTKTTHGPRLLQLSSGLFNIAKMWHKVR